MFEFKELTTNDINRIMEIETTSFPKSCWEKKNVYLERIKTFPEGNLGIWSNNSLIGFITSELWIHQKDYNKNRFMLSHKIDDYHDYTGNELYISSFAIDKDFRTKGLGTVVFKEFLCLMETLFNLKNCILLVSCEWQNAVKIYKNNEFESIDLIKDFFLNDNQQNFDGIILRKTF